MARLDSLTIRGRILDAIAKNPNLGFNELWLKTGLPKTTLAKTLNYLEPNGYISRRVPEKLGRGKKSSYKLEEKGLNFLREKKTVLSLIENINELCNLNINGTPVNSTFLLSEERLLGAFISLDKKLADKLFEKLGGARTVCTYKRDKIIPEPALKVFTRLAQAFSLVIIKSVNSGGPIIYADGEAFNLPEFLEKPLAELLRSPRGVELLALTVKLYKNMSNNNLQKLSQLLSKLKAEDVEALHELLED